MCDMTTFIFVLTIFSSSWYTQGILSVVDHGPPYVNLVIETDESLTVSAIKYDLITMEKNKNAAAQTKEKGFASVYDRIGRIIDLIEYRLKDGNYFVDIIDSYRDPTAKEGLRRARKWVQGADQRHSCLDSDLPLNPTSLALEALNKDASSPPARQNA